MAINFDGSERLISLTAGTTVLDVKDLYSRWKDWVKDTDEGKNAPAFSPLGGDPVDPGQGTSVPLYAFLQNGWRIRPQEADHTLNVTNGILLVQGGGDPFVDTLGNYVVRINYQQPVQALNVGLAGNVEPGFTVESALRLILAGIAGKLSGAPVGPILIRDVNDTKNRISATVDASGNRTSVTFDVS